MGFISSPMYSKELTPLKYEICADCDFCKNSEGNGMHLRDEAKGELLFCHLKRIKEGEIIPAHNSAYPKVAVQWFIKLCASFKVGVWVDSKSLRSRTFTMEPKKTG